MKRRAKLDAWTTPAGKTIRRAFVRCPGRCGGTVTIHRCEDGKWRINGHGGGRLGLASCDAWETEVQLTNREEVEAWTGSDGRGGRA